MQKKSPLELYSPVILRLGMSLVMLWFSLQQFMHTQSWIAYVPDSAVTLTHMSAMTLVHVNAIFELVFGVLLVFGFQTRIVALLLSLHLFGIMYTIGYTEIGVRDFGLAVALFSIFMHGPDVLCVQKKYEAFNTMPEPRQPLQQSRKLVR